MRVDDLRNAGGKVWLNVACSTFPLEGFANFDNHIFLSVLKYPFLARLVPRRNRNVLDAYREAAKIAPIHRHDCRRPLPLPEGSVDHILCSHFLEHVYPAEATGILADFRRVLKPGGTAHIIVPDIAAQVDEYVRARGTDPEAANAFIRGTLLTKEARPSFRYRLMEFRGNFGLQHLWMYDQASMEAKIREAGLAIVEGENRTPSADWRKGDDSVHVVAVR